MSTSSEHISQLINRDYEAGWTTDIEQDTAPPGLDESIVRFISAKKREPEWLLEWRLKAFRHWTEMKVPTWAAAIVATGEATLCMATGT